MPGGYGTDEESTPWGAAGTSYVSPGQTSSPYQPGGGSTNQGGSNALADAINIANAAPPQLSFSQDLQNQANQAIIEENIRRGIGSYPPPPVTQMLPETGGKSEFGGYLNAQQQLAASLLDAGALTSGALGGQALWSQLPVGMAEEIISQGGDPTLYENEYFSSFAPGAQAHSPTGIIEITGEEGIPAYIGRDEDGNLIPNPDPRANKYSVVNPYPSFDQRWSGMDDWDYNYYGDYGGGRPETASLSDPKYWAQKGLGELSPTGFANLEQMYGEELANKMAAPHAWGIEPFSEMIVEGDY
tara:strand:+ start:302 stop:1201 length:900 start_codon:yes stop_codon:yes gene_type:complete